MSCIKKFAAILITAVFITAFLPFAERSGEDSSASASAEVRFKANANALGYGISRQYVAWRTYKDGAYNIYVYSFADKNEIKANAQALSQDAIGPFLYQRYVYWVDHLSDGWTVNQYDILNNTVRVLRKTDARIDLFTIADAYLAYSVRTIDAQFNQAFLLTLADMSERALTDGKTWVADIAVYDKTAVWTQYPSLTVFQSDVPKGDIVRYEVEPRYTSILIPSLIRPVSVRLLGTTLAFTHQVSGRDVISIYYLNTGTSYQLTSPNVDASYPFLADNLIAYIRKDDGVKRVMYFQFGKNAYVELAQGTGAVGLPAVSPDGRLIAWSDNRVGTADLYYYDLDAEKTGLDQDNDGLNDAEEFTRGAQTYKADTDGDGLLDGEEVNRYHTRSTKWDTDGDGLSDGEEVLRWMTNPLASDSNSNGLSDAQDLRQGFSPVEKTQQFTSYAGIMRLPSLGDEFRKSELLRDELDTLLGEGRWHARGRTDWFKMVNAYVYGGYTVEEAASYVRGNKYALSDNTPAEYWRSYQSGIGHSTTAYVSGGNGLYAPKSSVPRKYQAKIVPPVNLPKVYSSSEATPSNVKNVYKATYYLLP